MKKRKLITKIIACVLIGVLVLGLIVPVVSADEITGNDYLDPLPDGFQYTSASTGAGIVKSAPNGKTAFQLSGYDADMDIAMVSIFVGNLETQEVIQVPLSKPHYLVDIDLDDGYYVIFNGGYAWQDANSLVYELTEYQYFYVGNNFKNGTFVGVNFEIYKDDIIGVQVEQVTDTDANIVNFGDHPSVDASSIVFPSEAIPPKGNTTAPTEPVEPNNDPNNNANGNNGTTDNNSQDEDRSIFAILWDAIKDSIVLIALIAACYIAITIMKTKKQNSLEKRTENDKYDDKRIE